MIEKRLNVPLVERFVVAVVLVGLTAAAVGGPPPATAAPGGEQAILDQARANITRLRQTQVTLTVVDAGGRPLADTPVTVELMRHQFDFGGNAIFLTTTRATPVVRDRLATLLPQVFNHYVWAGFSWDRYEPQRGSPDHAAAERVLQWVGQHSASLNGAALIYTSFQPEWFKQVTDADERYRVAEARVRDVVGRFQGRVPSWVVANEVWFGPLLTDPAAQLTGGMPIERVLGGIADYVDRAFRWAREADPNATLILNDTRLLSGTGLERFETILRELRRRGTPLDGVGIQAHMGFEGRVSLDRIWGTFDRLAQYGRLYVTEVTVPTQPPGAQDSAFQRERWWEGWTEQTQAEYLAQLYTVAFGHPAVHGITYWDMIDGVNFWRSATLIRGSDLQPRPSFETLRRLIRQEWSTRFEGRTDANGAVRFQGFYGNYGVSATVGGTRRTAQIRVRQGEASIRVTF
jgi:GH35 family endo-1,4-beta-xylanase